VELGILSFDELAPEPGTGHTIATEVRLRHLLEEIEVGLDVFVRRGESAVPRGPNPTHRGPVVAPPMISCPLAADLDLG
jgi:hypothetical protein